jgi:von Willebrand factor type A domain-containing protein
MRADLTDIILVVDRSGSMASVKEDAEGGVNAFIAKQAEEPGEALVTLLQFDTEYEFQYQGVPIHKAPRYELNPRGMTALLDAVGRAINETGERLAKMAEQDRPSLVVFVVMTDGQENSSQEFTKSQLKKMIERQQKEFNWHFTFLGANQDAFAEAGGMGINAAGVANYTAGKVAAAWQGTASKVARMRGQRSAGKTVTNEFTTEEREEMT